MVGQAGEGFGGHRRSVARAFGAFDTMMIVLVAFMVIDYATGMLVA